MPEAVREQADHVLGRLERIGVAVVTYEGTELSKGDGGPTCLTLPLHRS